jgi:thioredoxin reductase
MAPLPLETFVDYGRSFQSRLVPEVEQTLLVRLERDRQGFRAFFDSGEVVTARKIVLAVGVHHFKQTPQILADLPEEALSHSGDHGPLDRFAGREVVVLGAGSSAIDLAALLHEAGASVTLAARARALRFAGGPRPNPSLIRRLASPLRPLVRPGSGIGPGWLLKTCAEAPSLIHALPARRRLRLVATTLGPIGGAGMKERVEGRFPLLLDRELISAEPAGGGARLDFVDAEGETSSLRADHVIAATGYKVDLTRLAFLDPALLGAVRMIEAAPLLSANYETSVPGLHLIGPAAAPSFGPVARFVFGAKHPSRRLARHFAGAPPVLRPAEPWTVSGALTSDEIGRARAA